MVHGLLIHGRFTFNWCQNKHLPWGYEDLFSPIDGINFTLTKEEFVSKGKYGQVWNYPKGCNESELKDAYQKVLNSLIYSNEPKRSFLAGHARFFYKTEKYSVPPFILSIELAANAKELKADSIALYCDSRRNEVSKFLNKEGLKVILPQSSEMKKDYDRGSYEDFLLYIKDWQSMLKSDVLVTGSKCSSALHPFMASGKELVRLKK